MEGAKGSIRHDIQGLRMVAVVAVIFDHLLGWPSGGFVGVDIFFVISGFLITGLLLREHEKTGTISFTAFYRRRIKRIIPAATLVLVVTIAAGFIVFSSGRAMSTLGDAVWSFFFGANWHFASVGTDYFQAAGPLSPLQHFWSLSVEEQFYLVWPWLMLLIFLFARRRRWSTQRSRRAVGVAMLVITMASFAWAVYETATSPGWAYFSTFSRAWELGLGALIATFAGVFQRIPSVLRPALGWVGLSGIAASLFLISDDSAFPAPWAALPVFATALVIVAGTGGEVRYMWPITNPVARWVGNISYSLYLWHFPVIVILAVLMPATGMSYYIVAGALMLVLAVAAYYGVENPVRKSHWLDQRTAADKRRMKNGRRRRRMVPNSSSAFRPVIGLGIVAAITAILVVTALLPRPINNSASGTPGYVAATPTSTAAEQASPASPIESLQERIGASATAAEWPELTPSIDNLEAAKAPEWDKCLTTTPDEIEECTFGPASSTKTAFLVGDSVAISWLPGIRAALEPAGYRVMNMTMQQCPNAEVEIVATNGNAGGTEIVGFNDDCLAHREWVAEQAASVQPDLLIMSNNLQSLSSGAGGAEGDAVWREGYVDYMNRFAGSVGKIVLLDLPPVGKNLAECKTNFNRPSDCMTDIPDYWEGASAVNEKAVNLAREGGLDASHVRTAKWVCTLQGACPAFVGSTIVRADTLHLTAEYSTSLSPFLSEALIG